MKGDLCVIKKHVKRAILAVISLAEVIGGFVVTSPLLEVKTIGADFFVMKIRRPVKTMKGSI
jgi:hypothetical protein